MAVNCRRLLVVFGVFWFCGLAQAGLLGEESDEPVIHAAQQLMVQGKGVAAVRSLLPHARRGHAGAAYWLGRLYFYDEAGVSRDYAVAAKWFSRAAAAGHSGAQYKLAGMYFVGRGLDEDLGLAVQWWMAAARQHHAESLNNLGALLATGQGVAQDAELGMALQILAAEAGSESALENLRNKEVSVSARALAEVLASDPARLAARLSGLKVLPLP